MKSRFTSGHAIVILMLMTFASCSRTASLDHRVDRLEAQLEAAQATLNATNARVRNLQPRVSAAPLPAKAQTD